MGNNMATQASDPWPDNISQNQQKIDIEAACPACGYEGKGWVRETYSGGVSSLIVCPECRSGY